MTSISSHVFRSVSIVSQVRFSQSKQLVYIMHCTEVVYNWYGAVLRSDIIRNSRTIPLSEE